MKVTIRYESTDGVLWETEAQCAERDRIDARVRELEAQLRPHVRSDVRRELNRAVVADAKRAVVELCREQFPREAIFRHDAEDIHPMSYAGRFLDDTGGPIRRIWFRFASMSKTHDYEQPYFALNEHKFAGRTIGWSE